MRVAMLVGAGLLLAMPAAAEDGPEHYIFAGNVGPYRAGADIEVAGDHKTIRSASYFYASKGVDIPLKGGTRGENVTLVEPGGGTFALHFQGNGSAKPPLDFYTSVALVGSWSGSGSGRTYPVKLGLDFTPATAQTGRRWYADVTKASDAQFEALAHRFLAGVTTGNRAMAASAFSYPLSVVAKKPFKIINRAQLLQKWDAIFTPSYVATLRTAIWHKMFVRDGSAMVASGAVWFDAKGAKTLNTGL